jgi:ketosteroid isomerase-like protein
MLLALGLACSFCMSAQQSGRIETRTRLVSQFSELQNQWLHAVQTKDAAALERLLSEDFEVWTPAHTGPIPLEDWQAQAFSENLKSFRFADLAVKSPRDGIAIESFRLETTTSRKGSDVTENFFVVNLWVSDKDSWRCTDSYVSPVTASASTAPTKPTGKN